MIWFRKSNNEIAWCSSWSIKNKEKPWKFCFAHLKIYTLFTDYFLSSAIFSQHPKKIYPQLTLWILYTADRKISTDKVIISAEGRLSDRDKAAGEVISSADDRLLDRQQPADEVITTAVEVISTADDGLQDEEHSTVNQVQFSNIV